MFQNWKVMIHKAQVDIFSLVRRPKNKEIEKIVELEDRQMDQLKWNEVMLSTDYSVCQYEAYCGYRESCI